MSSVAQFQDLLQGARRAQSYEFLRMRAQFLLYPLQLLKMLDLHLNIVSISEFLNGYASMYFSDLT